MSSESDFEEVDIERFEEESENCKNRRESADSFTGKQSSILTLFFDRKFSSWF